MTSNLPGDPRDFFKPEFVNRIDDIVRFRSLTKDDLREIVDIQLRSLEKRMAAKRLTLVVTPAAKAQLGELGFDEAFGARPLKRLLQTAVADKLATALLEGRYTEGDTVTVDAEGGDIVLC
jgi:ATP-dependent Clp protease ATP-binding subunit ClpB